MQFYFFFRISPISLYIGWQSWQKSLNFVCNYLNFNHVWCHSRISLTPQSRPIVAEASARLEELKQKASRQNDEKKKSDKEFSDLFSLPLLTIIPVHSLGVNNVDISFEMEVK